MAMTVRQVWRHQNDNQKK